MTEMEWLDCTDPQKMLEFLRGKVAERRLRRFAVACVLSGRDSQFREVAELLDEFLEGRVDAQTYEWVKAWHGPLAPGTIHRCGGRPDIRCRALLSEDAWEAATSAAGSAVADAEIAYYHQHRHDDGFEMSDLGKHRRAIQAAQAELFREIFGNPFLSVTLNRKCLSSTARTLAQVIYDDRAFDQLPILADALEEVGCSQEVILKHLRSGVDHVRGCWALDLVLGKE